MFQNMVLFLKIKVINLLMFLWGNFLHKPFVRFGEPSLHGFVLQATCMERLWVQSYIGKRSARLMLAPSAYKAWVGCFSCRCGTALEVFPCRLRTKSCGLGSPKRTNKLAGGQEQNPPPQLLFELGLFVIECFIKVTIHIIIGMFLFFVIFVFVFF